VTETFGGSATEGAADSKAENDNGNEDVPLPQSSFLARRDQIVDRMLHELFYKKGVETIQVAHGKNAYGMPAVSLNDCRTELTDAIQRFATDINVVLGNPNARPALNNTAPSLPHDSSIVDEKAKFEHEKDGIIEVTYDTDDEFFSEGEDSDDDLNDFVPGIGDEEEIEEFSEEASGDELDE